MRALRIACEDRPEPAAIFGCRLRPHDAANMQITVEHVVVVIRPLAARAGFRGAFEDEHGSIIDLVRQPRSNQNALRARAVLEH